MYSFMISEVGLAGAGKTTALVQLCGKNAFLISEQKREPTEDEKKAWHSDEPVSTSWYPNFGSLILRFNNEYHKFEIDQEAGQVGEGEYLINIIDTCGQQPFFKHSEEQLPYTNGILFFFDASRDPEEYKLEIQNVFNTIQHLYQGEKFPPIVMVANKQDLVQKWKIGGGGHGRELMFQRILGSRDPFFNKVPFVGASALEGWGIDISLDLLIKEIVKRVNPDLYRTILPEEATKAEGMY